jgi:Rrf2 family cysteine metabolism transcriptional repressor
MLLSTRMRYGSRALTELALAYGTRPVSLSEIAASQNLSAKYLAQIMNALRAGELVVSVRGSTGGYELAASPERITLRDVYGALEGAFELPECVEHPETCQMEGVCPTRDTWVEVGEAVRAVLAGTTLRDLANRAREKRGAAAPMYYI